MTRKELSNMIGLRIETIIRTIKKMEKDGNLKVKLIFVSQYKCITFSLLLSD
ncbi:helix-turn-helix domain-containing protein [Cloacibacterium sp.]|uniref:helix-turn-helix domain-containing protein n=1 Tax=Cloacibacterium sp. TaxID=1913682 RepID=UPI0035B29D6D